MGGVVAHVGAERVGFDLSARGYQVLFRPNESNRCPGCGRGQWLVGRITAECAFCATALPLAEARWGRSGGWSNGRSQAPGELPSESLDHAERRRQPRKAGDGRIVTLLLDGTPHSFSVLNYSASGVMVAAPAELLAARSVEIVAPSGEIVAAERRWTGGDYTGLRFAKALPLVLSSGKRAL